MEVTSNPAMATNGHATNQDVRWLEARAQAFEEAVSLALFTSAWLQHSRKDPRASQIARMIARLLAASSAKPSHQGSDSFAAARNFLGQEYE
jgi:hypothetical protein